MGFSLVAAFGIIGVSILIALEIFTGSVLPSITNVNDSYKELIDRGIDKVQTDINITNIVVTPNGPNYDHAISIHNGGSVTLETSDCTLLLNGVVRSFSCSESYLYPEKNVVFTISNIPGAGAQRLKIITENGVSDYYEYTIV
jgi:archaellum component FlaF (FlaF/FlaG flagellin family)